MAFFNNALLVDDDPTTNFINEQFLRLNNLAEQILIFEDPVDALDFMGNKGWQGPSRLGLPDLLLLDINMPLMNGFEFLDALLDLERLPSSNIFVFLLSSSLDRGDIAKAKRYPLAGYLQKPLDEDKIQQIIQVVALAP